jgi:hypothetical protein
MMPCSKFSYIIPRIYFHPLKNRSFDDFTATVRQTALADVPQVFLRRRSENFLKSIAPEIWLNCGKVCSLQHFCTPLARIGTLFAFVHFGIA